MLWRAKIFWSAAVCLAAFLAAGPALAEPSQGPVFTARPALQVQTLTGFTRERARLRLVSEVSGRCLKVLYDVGDTVGPRGVFAVLDDTFVALELEANQVEQERLASRVAYLSKETGRYRALVQKHSEAPSKLDRLEDELSQARLALTALKTQRKVLTERLVRHTIKAPAGWKVIERLVEPGQWVNVGAAVAQLGDFRTLVVPLALDPRQYEILRKAPRPLMVFLPDQGAALPAAVSRLSPAFDPVTRKLALELELNKGLQEHRGGLRAEFKLSAPDPSGAVLLPAAAVQERYQEHWLTRENGQQVRVVLLGSGPEGALRVSSPQVKPGQRFLAPGQK
ncbi:MAG: HlyD family efflux transporter periplasmic adaptor subunit [Desulfarculus sp.]|nr:MAG: HlyD family efflux transporter periplasmic adaptor subunit [Desulfarculus sp.]